MRDARKGQRATIRAFAAELAVSHSAVAQWEKGVAAPTLERLEAWLADPREWVYSLAFKILVAKLGPALLAAATSQPTQPEPAPTAA